MSLSDKEKIVLDNYRNGMNTNDIADLLNKMGHKTTKGSKPYHRKAVNNHITLLRLRGVDTSIIGKDMTKKKQIKVVERQIYLTPNGNFQVRVTINKKLITKTFNSQEEAVVFRNATLSKRKPTQRRKSPLRLKKEVEKVFKETPKKESKIQLSPIVEMENPKDSSFIFIAGKDPSMLMDVLDKMGWN